MAIPDVAFLAVHLFTVYEGKGKGTVWLLMERTP